MKARSYTDFIVAGKRQPLGLVFCSLLATVFGASATIGVIDRAAWMGTPAFWWLASGSLGLLVQGVFLSRRIRELDADTLPDLAGRLAGRGGRWLVAGVIGISWIGVVAAQFAAVAQVLGWLWAPAGGPWGVAVAAVAVIAYTAAGGQVSVVRTDRWQFLLLAAALGALAAWMSWTRPVGYWAHFELFNEAFPPGAWPGLALTVGGAFLVGPDILSRTLLARDAATARRAALLAALGVAVCGLVVTYIGVWTGTLPGEGGGLQRLFAGSGLPGTLAVLAIAGLLAALLSSADTCLVNAAAIWSHDLLGVRRVWVVRSLVVGIGLLATGLALRGGDIIGLLLTAYSIYTPGIVPPLVVAILAHPRWRVSRPVWGAAVAAGSLLGAVHTAWPGTPEWLPAVGVGVSLAVAVGALRRVATTSDGELAPPEPPG